MTTIETINPFLEGYNEIPVEMPGKFPPQERKTVREELTSYYEAFKRFLVNNAPPDRHNLIHFHLKESFDEFYVQVLPLILKSFDGNPESLKTFSNLICNQLAISKPEDNVKVQRFLHYFCKRLSIMDSKYSGK